MVARQFVLHITPAHSYCALVNTGNGDQEKSSSLLFLPLINYLHPFVII